MQDAELSAMLARARALPEKQGDNASLSAMLQQAREIPYSSRPTPLGPPPERPLDYPTKLGPPQDVELIPAGWNTPAETMTVRNPEITYGPPSVKRSTEEERMSAYGEENPPSAYDRWTNMSSAIIRGFTSGTASIPQGVSWAASQLDRMFGKDKDLKDYALYQLGDSLKKAVDEQVPADPRLAGAFETKAGEGIGNVPTFLGAGAVGKLPALVMMGASQSGVSSYDQAKAAGADEDTAKDVSTYSALLGGVTMPLPYYRILGRLNAASGGALNAALRGGTEAGVASVIQRMGENKIAQVYDKERPLLEGVADAGGVGGIVGALSAGLLHFGKAITTKPGYEQPRSTNFDQIEPIRPNSTISATSYKPEPLEVTGTFKMTPEEASKLGIKDAVFDPETTAKIAALEPTATKKQFASAIGKKLSDVKEMARSGMRDIIERAKEFQDAQEGLSAVRGNEGEVREGGNGLRRGPDQGGEDSQRQGVQGAARGQEEVTPTGVKPQYGAAAGIVQLDKLAATMKQGWSALKALAKENLVVGGDLPKAVSQLDAVRRRNVGEIVAKAGFAARDFEKAMETAYGDLASDPHTRATVDAAMKAQGGISGLPADIQPAAQTLRDHVDVLSQRLIDEGVVDGALEATVDQNKGVYLHRSYKVFDDPKWAENVDPVVRNKFKSWLRSQNPGDTDAQLEQKINNLLYEGKAAQGPIAFLSRSKLGAKDLSILKGRTLDNFPELRALYGEYTDPVTNYAKSVVRMANLLESHKFLSDVRDAGLAQGFLFEEGNPNIDPEAKVRIAADGSDPMHPLNGLYTYPEVEKAFREAVSHQPEERTWVRWLIKSNVLAKMANTVYSHQTQARNILGNVPMVAANGHYRVGKAADAFGAVMADLGFTNDAAKRQSVLDGIKYGILRQSVQAGDLNEMLDGLKKSDMDLADMIGGPGAKLGKKIQSGALKAYGLGDDGPRYYGWLNEQANYKGRFPGMTQPEFLQYTADIVNNTMPNYEALPPIIRKLRNFPGGNTFVSFPASMVKASYGILRQSAKEIANPVTRDIGVRRLVSFMAVKVAPKAIALGAAAMLGIDSQDDEALRESLPPWDENGEIMWLQKPSAENSWTFAYTNPSSIDPFGMFDRAVIAASRGESPAAGFAAGSAEMLKNFIGEQMVVEKLVDVMRNKRGDNAQPVYNPEDDGMQILESITKHLTSVLVPGSAKSANRLVKAYKGEETETGQIYDPTTETIAQFGIRASKGNLKTSLYYDAKEFARRTADAESIAAGKLLAVGPVSETDLASAQERSDRNRRELFDQFHKHIVNMRKLGLPDEEIATTLRFAGLSGPSDEYIGDAAAVFYGIYRPYFPSQQGLRSTAKKMSIVNPKGIERMEERITAPQ